MLRVDCRVDCRADCRADCQAERFRVYVYLNLNWTMYYHSVPVMSSYHFVRPNASVVFRAFGSTS